MELSEIETGQAICVDLRSHKRLVGRVVDRRPESTWVRRRDGVVVEVLDERVLKAKQVEGLFDSGDAVVKCGQPTWRGGVVRTEGSAVLVETKFGFVWVDESEIVDPIPCASVKPGPPAADPHVDSINEEAFARAGRTGWAS